MVFCLFSILQYNYYSYSFVIHVILQGSVTQTCSVCCVSLLFLLQNYSLSFGIVNCLVISFDHQIWSYVVRRQNCAETYHSTSGSFSVWVKLNSDEVRPLEVYASALHQSPQCWSNAAPMPAFHVHADILALHFSFIVTRLKHPWWDYCDTRVASGRCCTAYCHFDYWVVWHCSLRGFIFL